MKILIIKFRHIGDVLLTTPLITTLKNHFEDSQITVLVKAGTEAMLTDNPDIHNVVVLPKRDKKKPLWKHLKNLSALLFKLRKQRFDLSLNTTEGDRGIIISALVGAKKKLGYLHEKEKSWRKSLLTEHIIWGKSDYHTVLQNLDLATQLLNIDNKEGISVSLFYEPHLQQKVESLLANNGWNASQPIVHIHPVSRWFFKCWQDEKMASTIDFIQTTLNAVVVLTCGPDTKEITKLQAIIQHCKTKPINMGGLLTLKELAALSDLATLFFGVDSAPMHMAAALNTPVVAIFGPSQVKSWGPWPNDWTHAETPYEQHGIQKVSPHVVLQHNWPCVPCSQAGCDNKKVSNCLVELPEHWVQEALYERWEALECLPK